MLILLSFCLYIGCGTPSGNESTDGAADAGTNATAENKTGDSSRESDETAVTLTVVDEAGFQQALAKHRGQVIFIDYWATWCGACKKEFPNTVALHEAYADDGLAVISMSFDTEDRQEAAIEFLREHGATFDNLRSQYGTQDASFEMCSFDDNLPYYQLYDREGNLVQGFSFSDPVGPAVTFADIERAVQRQLSAGGHVGE